MKNLILFDADGVLFDVARSYRQTIADTVCFYMQYFFGIKCGKKCLVSQKDIDAFKYFGGFNDDWDLTAGLLFYFVSLLDLSGIRIKAKKTTIAGISGMADEIKEGLPPVGAEGLIRRKNIKRFLSEIPKASRGLRAVKTRVRNAPRSLVFHEGSPFKTNVVRRVFQEFYFGAVDFEKIYGRKPYFVKKKGSYKSEKLIIPKSMLRRLSKKNTLGIVTGRCKEELSPVLAKYNLGSFFNVIVTIDDVWREEKRRNRSPMSFSKPHPFSLLYACKKGSKKKERCFYVGDQPDDVRAANRAKKEFPCFVSVGFSHTGSAQHLMKLKNAGADIVVGNKRDLIELFC